MKIAPVYDLGSALFPQIDEKTIAKILKSKIEMNRRVNDMPTSVLLIKTIELTILLLLLNTKILSAMKLLKELRQK